MNSVCLAFVTGTHREVLLQHHASRRVTLFVVEAADLTLVSCKYLWASSCQAKFLKKQPLSNKIYIHFYSSLSDYYILSHCCTYTRKSKRILGSESLNIHGSERHVSLISRKLRGRFEMLIFLFFYTEALSRQQTGRHGRHTDVCFYSESSILTFV
jgi:hypothetical protein